MPNEEGIVELSKVINGVKDTPICYLNSPKSYITPSMIIPLKTK